MTGAFATDVVAGSLGAAIEVRQLKGGHWRAYFVYETTPGNRNSNYGETREVVRDLNWRIITGSNRDYLIKRLRAEYPMWNWSKAKEEV